MAATSGDAPRVNEWQRVGGRAGGTITAIAGADQAEGARRLFAGTMSGVYVSDDGGDSWRISNRNLTSPYVQALVASPAVSEDGTVFLGVVGGGAFKSFDRGDTWNQLAFWSTMPNVVGIGLSPAYATDRMAFLGSDADGVFRSTNGGRSWNPSSSGADRAVGAGRRGLAKLHQRSDDLCGHRGRGAVPLDRRRADLDAAGQVHRRPGHGAGRGAVARVQGRPGGGDRHRGAWPLALNRWRAPLDRHRGPAVAVDQRRRHVPELRRGSARRGRHGRCRRAGERRRRGDLVDAHGRRRGGRRDQRVGDGRWRHDDHLGWHLRDGPLSIHGPRRDLGGGQQRHHQSELGHAGPQPGSRPRRNHVRRGNRHGSVPVE